MFKRVTLRSIIGSEASITGLCCQTTSRPSIITLILDGCFGELLCGNEEVVGRTPENLAFFFSFLGVCNSSSDSKIGGLGADKGVDEVVPPVSGILSGVSDFGGGNFTENADGGGRPRGLAGVTVLVGGSWPRKFHSLVKSPRLGRSFWNGTLSKTCGGLPGLSAGVNAKNRLITGERVRPESIQARLDAKPNQADNGIDRK